MKEDEIVRPCDRHSNDTVTPRKHVTKYKNMQKWMVEFLRKFENCGIKIAKVNIILVITSINLQLFTLILFGVGQGCWGPVVMLTFLNLPPVLSPFIEKSMCKYIKS